MLLRIEDLHVHYGNIEALKGISLEVREQEIVTLVGSNGAGKSTTLLAVSALVRKTGGRVLFRDVDISRRETSEIARLGICHVQEGRHIFPYLSVEENLIMGSLGNPDQRRLKENLANVYDLFPRLAERRRQHGGTLSGGEQQMLAIGRGLMLDPQLIMLDEPSLGLAPILVEQIFELIMQIRDLGRTILLIEQNASMALQISDRAYVLETGKITAAGAAETLIDDPRVRKAYLGG